VSGVYNLKVDIVISIIHGHVIIPRRPLTTM